MFLCQSGLICRKNQKIIKLCDKWYNPNYLTGALVAGQTRGLQFAVSFGRCKCQDLCRITACFPWSGLCTGAHKVKSSTLPPPPLNLLLRWCALSFWFVCLVLSCWDYRKMVQIRLIQWSQLAKQVSNPLDCEAFQAITVTARNAVR